MRKHNEKKSMRGLGTRISAMILVLVLLVQSLAFGTFALAEDIALELGELDPSLSLNGTGKLSVNEISEALRNDLIKSMNENLVQQIDKNELTGPVGVIITFSDDSMVSTYSASKYYDRMTYAAFRATGAAQRLNEKFVQNQNKVLERINDSGLVEEVKYTYVHIMDGAYLRTTYENIEAISKIEGVERVMISNTYLPQAVSNPVDVYETGIFNSGSVEYTGKGTLVAVLDTGCDYSHSAFTTYTVESPAFNRDYVAGKLSETVAWDRMNGDLEVREVYYGNITGQKIVYGFDYADNDPDIMPANNEHGTHVAGIIAGKDDKITGVAIDAQLAIMKVFSDYKTGADDGDVMAGVEDSVVLGVDAINMSLGTSCGFVYESAVDKEYKNGIYGRVEEAGISLIVAASNDYSSGMGGEEGNTNKTDNPDSATVGAPSTYDAAMSVASINGKKDYYMLANGETPIFFSESNNHAAKPYDFFKMLGITEGKTVTYDYVTVPGNGYKINYSAIDVKGKIALVKRGDITFEEKVQFAQEAGAVAVIIYNHLSGNIYMTIGNHAKIPAVSISKDDGMMLAAQESGQITFSLDNKAGPFMSDFSSWGPTPSLTLKPEITAHGGNILSAVLGGDYEELSGTSMAAPNMCGITVLIRQYVKENFGHLTEGKPTAVRDFVNMLCMSTATIALDRNGNPYSPRKQGAGIADIRKSTTTGAYLFVEDADGTVLGKTKFELGDDPKRTGVYEMVVGIANISDDPVSYKLGDIVMTESVSTADPEFVSEIAYLLSNTTEYSIAGDGSLAGDVVTVEAGKKAYLTVKITLSAADKAYINSTFENGMYVEGFLTFDNTDENGVDLNAPFLAFYGDWGEAPIFDLDYYEVETEAHNNAIDDDDKIKADYYATTPLGTYYYDYVVPLGSYLYKMAPGFKAIPATTEKAAVSYYSNAISGLYAVYAGLLRGAKEMSIEVVNTVTGEVVWEDIQYNCYKSHYRGGPSPYAAKMQIDMINLKTGTVFADNNTKFEVIMKAKLDWEGGENVSDTYSFSFYVDYEAPNVTKYEFRTEEPKNKKDENRYYLDLWVYDNHYAMSCRPVVVYDSTEKNDKGEYKKTYSSLSEYPTPVYQQTIGSVTKVSIEITDYLDKIANSSMPNGIAIYLDDYALNSSVCYIPFPGTENAGDIGFIGENGDVEFDRTSIDLDINETLNLAELLVYKDSTITLELDYLKTLRWEIESGSDFIIMKNGMLEARKEGTALIRVTSDSWVSGTGQNKVQLYKYITVNVSGVEIENPESGGEALMESLVFTHFKTIFAHNSDIDYSEIGRTGDTNYINKSTSISCYPGEIVKLFYQLEPWNLDSSRCKFIWSSSNGKVATVTQEGRVEAFKEGKTRIRLNVEIDGKLDKNFEASIMVNVKSEFIIANRELKAYKGRGGEVEIPSDEGILYIGKYAFSHYDMVNERPVEKDETGWYDIDLKKDPIGANKNVTKVIIPEGVEIIYNYAFWGCTGLEEVVLPESCINISYASFFGCTKLKKINLDNVKIVADKVFEGCTFLGTDDFVPNTDKLYAAGDYAFSRTALTKLSLPSLSRIGKAVFYNCESLAEVELGQRTRVVERMFEGTAVNSIVIWSDTIGDKAFYNCKNLTSVTVKGNLTYIGESAFEGCEELKTVAFDGEVEKIATNAFLNCKSITEITLPHGQVEIGDYAFSGTGVRKIVFRADTALTSVGTLAFPGSNGITVELPDDAVYKKVGNALYTQDGKTLAMVMPATSTVTFTVPAEVTTIGAGAFSSLPNIYRVSFASGSKLEKIGDAAFADCVKLTTVNLPDKAIEIGNFAFMNTSSLKSINLAKVTSIGNFAFYKSSLTTVTLETEGAEIGYGAFSEMTALNTVNLPVDVVIGDLSFAYSSVKTVNLAGNAKICNGAFYVCESLTSFDFADVKPYVEEVDGETVVVDRNALGASAFFACIKLKSVNLPYVVEIGENCFADCWSLESLTADNLEVVGSGAFATFVVPDAEKEPEKAKTWSANRLVSISLPKVTTVGDGVFYYNRSLVTVSLPSLTELGMTSFYECNKLTTVGFSEDLTKIADYTFLGCKALTTIDLSNVTHIGEAAFYGVPLSARLDLDSVEEIGDYAFYVNSATQGHNLIEEVYAPALKKLGELAFGNNESLAVFSAPALEYIGVSALSATAIATFEVSGSLTKVDLAAFQACDKLTSFFVTVDGEEKTTAKLGNVMVVDGALYVLLPSGGYALSCYPAAKEGGTLEIADGTVRIATSAAQGNAHLKHVVVPASVKTIGDYAFFECENLETVTFKSYYAPKIEGSMLGKAIDITAENRAEYPGFEKLYSYDYFYRLYDEVTYPYYYRTFAGVIGSADADGLVAIIPENSEGYDSFLYSAFFTVSTEANSGKTMGKYAVAFIEAVKKLPDEIDRFDQVVVENAIRAFNALAKHADEKAYIDDATIAKYNAAVSTYRVDVAENAIDHLFDMYRNEYSFNKVKEARAVYLQLTDAERAMVSNGDRLEAKIAELNEVFGTEIDFEKNYSDYPEIEPPVDEPTVDEGGLEAWAIILIVVGSVLVLGAGAVLTVLLLKKKQTAGGEPDANEEN